ncbi:MAG: hypothetical protein M1276_08300 [Deltaproteobacteria bacterium]|jgi:hypothetical protein|nr:hypothetical protein [Deltaproteobacteria bacterium]MDA8157619.1 hypothetical protein [Deltaproteobacteria bacterium]
MIDTVELQQIITNLPSVEKIAASSHVLAINSNNIIQKEMANTDEAALNTVVELSEVLEPVNDKNKNRKEEEKEKEEERKEAEEGAGGNNPHVDLVV